MPRSDNKIACCGLPRFLWSSGKGRMPGGMPGTHFEFDLVAIGGVLANRRLSVPIYQRSYAWGSEDPKERDQVTEFW